MFLFQAMTIAYEGDMRNSDRPRRGEGSTAHAEWPILNRSRCNLSQKILESSASCFLLRLLRSSRRVSSAGEGCIGVGGRPPRKRCPIHSTSASTTTSLKSKTMVSVWSMLMRGPFYGGESGIRTHGTLRYTRFPSVRLKPLGHLSRSMSSAAAQPCLIDFTILNLPTAKIQAPGRTFSPNQLR